MINVLNHLNLLGLRVKDCVTGLEGVVASVTFDLYGCIQAIVNPGLNKDGEPREGKWFDVNRLQVLDVEPVMPRPDFDWTPQAVAEGRKGCAERPDTCKT